MAKLAVPAAKMNRNKLLIIRFIIQPVIVSDYKIINRFNDNACKNIEIELPVCDHIMNIS